MSIEKELEKDGVQEIEELNEEIVEKITQNVANKIYNTFPNYDFCEEYLVDKLSELNMYKAKMPERNE